jgi:uncharacterized protein (DUF488 family)
MQMSTLLSVGHSNHTPDYLLHLLAGQSVTAVADVRSRPFSKRLPHFNQPELEESFRQHGIAYVFLGDLLGGRPQRRELYDTEGRVDYEKVRATEDFERGIDRLVRGLERHNVAFLCGEEDPLDCHRGLMITPALVELGISPAHLRKDGTMQTTPAMERELLEVTGVGGGMHDGLFAELLSGEERREDLTEAYRRMARKKAYRIPFEGAETGHGEEDESY